MIFKRPYHQPSSAPIELNGKTTRYSQKY